MEPQSPKNAYCDPAVGTRIAPLQLPPALWHIETARWVNCSHDPAPASLQYESAQALRSATDSTSTPSPAGTSHTKRPIWASPCSGLTNVSAYGTSSDRNSSPACHSRAAGMWRDQFSG